MHPIVPPQTSSTHRTPAIRSVSTHIWLRRTAARLWSWHKLSQQCTNQHTNKLLGVSSDPIKYG